MTQLSPQGRARAQKLTGSTVTECYHRHQMQGTGGHFYHSVGLLQCSICGGWQDIRKPMK